MALALSSHVSCRRGFSMLEFSLVLVIIGLIAGGVFMGKELIQTSKLRSVINDVERIRNGVSAFRTKYNTLPGDMNDATTYWGTDAGGCPAPAGSTTGLSPTTSTCNGNGNGFIETYTTTQETFRAWQHLANAGMIPGKYTGVCYKGSSCLTGNDQPRVGWNIPESKYASSGYYLINVDKSVYYTNASLTNIFWRTQAYDEVIVFGDDGSVANLYTTWLGALPHANFLGALNGDEAYAIDVKADDGLPNFGSVTTLGTGVSWYTTEMLRCAGNTTYPTTTTVNDESSKVPSCVLVFKLNI